MQPKDFFSYFDSGILALTAAHILPATIRNIWCSDFQLAIKRRLLSIRTGNCGPVNYINRCSSVPVTQYSTAFPKIHTQPTPSHRPADYFGTLLKQQVKVEDEYSEHDEGMMITFFCIESSSSVLVQDCCQMSLHSYKQLVSCSEAWETFY